MRLPPSPVRRLLAHMFNQALASTHAGQALRRTVRRDGTVLTVGRRRYDLKEYQRVVVVGAGKASAAMARSLERIVGRRLDDGVVVVKYGHGLPTTRIAVLEAGHPIPDRAGLTAARRVMTLVRELDGRDLLFVLLSGGASSLLPAPVSGVTLRDKQFVTDQLLRCGAGIAEINAVRKHLSELKGGRLAAMSRATMVTLILSDVIGDDLSAIGSGPTVPDPTTYGDAVSCLRRYGLWSLAPRSVRAHLTRGVEGRGTETPKREGKDLRSVQHEIVGNNALALAAITSTARSAGWRVLRMPPFTTEARQAGAAMGALARSIRSRSQPMTRPCCIVAGGETTVTMTGRGKGGRAQEFAVAAARVVAGLPRVVVAAIATDGSDGPTEVAGAVITGETWSRAGRMGIDLERALTRHDTYGALKRLNCHVTTGPTGTNVNDLYLLFLF
ncbi:MAG TPA: glycerate kinase [Nitrospira sp.]|nr:glycerate kinase [Nitrospira sp.]